MGHESIGSMVETIIKKKVAACLKLNFITWYLQFIYEFDTFKGTRRFRCWFSRFIVRFHSFSAILAVRISVFLVVYSHITQLFGYGIRFLQQTISNIINVYIIIIAWIRGECNSNSHYLFAHWFAKRIATDTCASNKCYNLFNFPIMNSIFSSHKL